MKWIATLLSFIKRNFLNANSSRTVRYAYSLAIFALLAAAGVASVINFEGSYVSLEVPNNRVAQNELFEIDVYANATEAVNAIDITLYYPEDKLEIFGIDTGESVITLWTTDPIAKNGQITLQGGAYRRGFRGKHLIATINARASEGGIVEFSADNIAFLAGDGTGDKVPVVETDEQRTQIYVFGETRTNADGEIEFSAEGTLRIITDIDGNGNVDMGDISAFMGAWGTGNLRFDFNGDSVVSFRDFAIILADSFFR